MSNLDPKMVRTEFLETRDSSGRRLFVSPTVKRPGGSNLQVFASDVDADNGDLILMGRYLIPLPDVVVEDHKLMKVNKVWVTKHQAQTILRLIGDDFKRLFRRDFGTVLFSFASKAVDFVLGRVGKVAGVVIDPVRSLALDNIFTAITKLVADRARQKADDKVERVADYIKAVLDKFVADAEPILKEIAPGATLGEYVKESLEPVLTELKDFLN